MFRKAVLTVIICLLTAGLYSQEKESSVLKSAGIDTDQPGWGPAVLLNTIILRFNGDYSLLSAGVGVGGSYKWGGNDKTRYNYEAGIYIAPQFQASDNEDIGTVSVIAHITFWKYFGIGIGYDFWIKGDGVDRPKKDSSFFTLGYSVTY